MNIALDYDDTYTKDPELWLAFVRNARHRGHKVYVVTWRSEDQAKDIDERLQELAPVYATQLRAKRAFMESKQIYIEIWIDDNPEAIIRNY